jgi:hypothetical protein
VLRLPGTPTDRTTKIRAVIIIIVVASR